MKEVREFLRAFISGGVNQDFKPWARELLGKIPKSEDVTPGERDMTLEQAMAIVNEHVDIYETNKWEQVLLDGRFTLYELRAIVMVWEKTGKLGNKT